MSTKSEKVWVIHLKGHGAIPYSNHRTSNAAIMHFMRQRTGVPWKEYRDSGYSCVRATITYEVPGEH